MFSAHEFIGTIFVIAAALDGFVPINVKSAISSALSRRVSIGNTVFRAKVILDRFFGKRLFSVRAISAYATMTFVSSIVLFFGLGAFNPEIKSIFYDNFSKSGIVFVIIIFIVAVFTIFADIVSYSKTRVFIRAMATQNSGWFNLTIIVSDFLASIVIFISIISIGRVFCYIILILYTQSNMNYKFRIAPSVISESAQMFNLETRVSSFDDSALKARDLALVKLVKSAIIYSKGGQVSVEEMAQNASIFQPDGLKFGFEFSNQKFSEKCYDSNNQSSDIINIESYDVYSNSLITLIQVIHLTGQEQFIKNNKYEDVQKSIKEVFDRQVKAGPPGCQIKIISIEQSYDAKKMLMYLEFDDLYLSSLNLTLVQTLRAVPLKFSNYEMPDLAKELPEFLGTAWLARATNFLGTALPIREFESLSTTIIGRSIEEKRKFYLPLTTIISSSLMASVVLCILMAMEKIGDYSALLLNKASVALQYEWVERAVFTSLAVVISLSILIYSMSWSLINWIWSVFIAIAS